MDGEFKEAEAENLGPVADETLDWTVVKGNGAVVLDVDVF